MKTHKIGLNIVERIHMEIDSSDESIGMLNLFLGGRPPYREVLNLLVNLRPNSKESVKVLRYILMDVTDSKGLNRVANYLSKRAYRERISISVHANRIVNNTIDPVEQIELLKLSLHGSRHESNVARQIAKYCVDPELLIIPWSVRQFFLSGDILVRAFFHLSPSADQVAMAERLLEFRSPSSKYFLRGADG